MSLWRDTWHVLNDPADPRYRWFHAFINVLIVLSICIVVYDVVEPRPLPPSIEIVDAVILTIFLFEYLARLWTVRNWLPKSLELTQGAKLRYFLLSRLRFMLSPWSIIDLLALIPLFAIFGGIGFAEYTWIQSVRSLRLLRLARAIQFFRYASPLQTLAQAFRDNSILFAVSASFVVLSIFVFAFMFFLAEWGSNEGLLNFGDSLWWAIVTISTVGFGDITPGTAGGKLIGAALMLTGMFVIAMFAGVISSSLVGHLTPLRLEQVRMSSITDHIIIAGWNERVPMMLAEMEREFEHDLPKIIVFAPRERPEELPGRYLFVQGDFTREQEYDKVRLAYADTVVVVADLGAAGARASLRDASSVLTVFTIRSFEKKLVIERAQPLHLIVEILQSENYEHAHMAGADEVIETSRVGSSLLAHTAGHPGIGEVISSLVLASRNNVYASELPSEFIEGRQLTFAELQDRARDELGLLVIGIIHHGHMRMNLPAQSPVYAADKMVYVGSRPLERMIADDTRT